MARVSLSSNLTERARDVTEDSASTVGKEKLLRKAMAKDSIRGLNDASNVRAVASVMTQRWITTSLRIRDVSFAKTASVVMGEATSKVTCNIATNVKDMAFAMTLPWIMTSHVTSDVSSAKIAMHVEDQAIPDNHMV